MRLTKGCFGSQFDHITVPGFDFLRCGQIRSKESFGHNSGWYNILGEKLGWGDLNKKDIEDIMKNLKDDEIFITLGEHDSFWNFVTEIGPIGSMSKTRISEQAPGPEYVAEHCRFIITNKGIFRKQDDYFPRDDYEIEGINIKMLPVKEVFKMFGVKT